MRALRIAFAVACLFIASLARAESVFPGASWEHAEPVAAGWSAGGLKEAEAIAKDNGSTAVMIVQDGRSIAEWGGVGRRILIHSMRKSILSALYGIGISDGKIKLDTTLKQLDLDDYPPRLSDAEKEATIRDLLMARSGIYHEAAAEPLGMKNRRPARGSHPHGTFWYYNNWDFNALGTIYKQLTGEAVFDAVEHRLAQPLGMQDFRARDGDNQLVRASEHPAYMMNMTARDLARFGLLYLNKGNWAGKQIVPAAWIAESTRPLSDAPGGISYGYLWWVSKGKFQLTVDVGNGAYSARGTGGQYLFVIPAYRLVVVHMYDMGRSSHEVTGKQVGALLQAIIAAAPHLANQPPASH